jgi:hypothetical protein
MIAAEAMRSLAEVLGCLQKPWNARRIFEDACIGHNCRGLEDNCRVQYKMPCSDSEDTSRFVYLEPYYGDADVRKP